MRSRRRWRAAVLGLIAAPAWAGAGPSTDSCSLCSGSWYTYTVTVENRGGPATYPNLAAAAAGVEAYMCGAGGPGGTSCTNPARRPFKVNAAACTWGNSIVTQDNVTVLVTSSNGGITRQNLTSTAETSCPSNDPDPCDLTKTGDTFWKEGTTMSDIPSRICDGPSNCIAKRDVTGICMGSFCASNYTISAEQCPEGPEPPALPADTTSSGDPGASDPERCIGDYCTGSKGTHCGYYNDEFLCLNKTPKDGCQRTADGALLCDADASTPPAPSTDTDRQVKATPDGTVDANYSNAAGTASNNATYNYYTSGTAAAAANASSLPQTGTATGGTGTATGSSGFSDGDGEGDEESEGSVTGGASCAALPVCEGNAIQCAIVEQQWRSRCTDDDGLQAAVQSGFTEGELDGTALVIEGDPVSVGMSSNEGPLSGGSCPEELSISVFGQSLDLNIWGPACTGASLFAPIVMAMAYLFAGLLVYRGVVT